MTINFTLGLVIGIELLAVAALLFIFGRAISRRWPRHAWLVSFANGKVRANLGEAKFPLRLVRGGA